MTEFLILVDGDDREIGRAEKLRAHKDGSLHRALSVFVFNSKGQLLLQRRALGKYHSPGLWSNTCCSHPRPGETVERAAARRLQEEMGMACTLSELFAFTYRHAFEDGLIEHERDHVLVGQSEMEPVADPAEVAEWAWKGSRWILEDIEKNADRYTYWFKLIVERVIRETPNRLALG